MRGASCNDGEWRQKKPFLQEEEKKTEEEPGWTEVVKKKRRGLCTSPAVFVALRKGVQQVLFRERYTSPKPTGQDNKSVAGIQKRNLHVSDVLMALGRNVKHKWSFVGNSEGSQCSG